VWTKPAPAAVDAHSRPCRGRRQISCAQGGRSGGRRCPHLTITVEPRISPRSRFGTTAVEAAPRCLGLSLVSLDPELDPKIATEAASLRGPPLGLLLPDAVVLATAKVAVGRVLTNDRRLLRDGAPPVVILDDAMARPTTSTLTAGRHTVSATYAGSTGYDASSSGTVTQTVNAPPPPAPAITVVQHRPRPVRRDGPRDRQRLPDRQDRLPARVHRRHRQQHRRCHQVTYPVADGQGNCSSDPVVTLALPNGVTCSTNCRSRSPR